MTIECESVKYVMNFNATILQLKVQSHFSVCVVYLNLRKRMQITEKLKNKIFSTISIGEHIHHMYNIFNLT